MSKTASITWQASEAATPPLLRIERKPSFGKRLETIEEESEAGGHGQCYNLKPPAAISSSGKDEFRKRNPPIKAA